jgi:subfamily B ATP-binding cassette protein MsbA
MITPILLNHWIGNDIIIGIKHMGSIAIILLISYFIQIAMIYFREHFALSFNIHQALGLTDKLFGLKYDDINEQGPTYFMERIAISVNSLYIYITDGFVQMLANIIIVFAIIILVFTFNPILALILLILLPINYFGYKLLNRELQRRSKIMQESTSSGWKDVLNICKETDYIKQLGTKDEIYSILEDPFSRIYRSMAKVNSFAQSISTTLRSLNELAKNFMILILAYGIITQGENPLTIVLFSIVLPIYFNAINGIVGANLASRDIKNSSEFIKYLEENQEKNGDQVVEGISQIDFVIKDLSIGDRILQSNINEVFRKGDIVSVNGESGTGKSTLMKLLPKFRTTDTVYINGTDIKNIENKSLRDNLVYMSQEVPIITGTLRDNLTLGNTVIEEEINNLKELSLLNSILSNKSMDTIIEENGTNLSGGEKQKIALARSIFSKADMFILDEITSNIDKITADEIYKSITTINKDKIMFIISHDKMHLPYCNKSIDLGVNLQEVLQ